MHLVSTELQCPQEPKEIQTLVPELHLTNLSGPLEGCKWHSVYRKRNVYPLKTRVGCRSKHPEVSRDGTTRSINRFDWIVLIKSIWFMVSADSILPLVPKFMLIGRAICLLVVDKKCFFLSHATWMQMDEDLKKKSRNLETLLPTVRPSGLQTLFPALEPNESRPNNTENSRRPKTVSSTAISSANHLLFSFLLTEWLPL